MKVTDKAPTPTQLIQQWRDQAQRIREDRPHVAQAIVACADEMEAALRPRRLSDAEVARLTDGTDDCDCGHALSRHRAAGCLAPAPLGSNETFCPCRRQVVRPRQVR